MKEERAERVVNYAPMEALHDLESKGYSMYDISAMILLEKGVNVKAGSLSGVVNGVTDPRFTIGAAIISLSEEVGFNPAITKNAKQSPPPVVKQDKLDKRSEIFEEMYRNGETLQEIGDKFGLTRERVRQIIRQRGITAKDGGAALRAGARKSALEKKKNRECLKRNGCGLDEFKRITTLYFSTNGDSPKRPYDMHRRNAHNRGIEFNLSFYEWFSIWEESGNWELRGRGLGMYCMSRKGDLGAYETGNVEIILFEDNSRDGRNSRGRNAYITRKIIDACGGFEAFSKAVDIKIQTARTIATHNLFPPSAREKAGALSLLTGRKYSKEEIIAACREYKSLAKESKS